MPHRVLITGGAGFIGSSVTDALLDCGDQVAIFDNFAPFYPRRRKEANIASALSRGATLIEGDVTRTEDMRRALASVDPDVIIHLAACAGVRPSIAQPAAYVQANVMGTSVVLEQAVKAGFGPNHGRILVASSSSVYGNNSKVPFAEEDDVSNPISPYAATKVATELVSKAAAHVHGLTISALRFFTVYGPRQRPDLAIASFLNRIAAREEITLFGDGSTSRDYTYISDIVGGVLAVLNRRGPGTGGVYEGYRCFNIGGDCPVTLLELVHLIETTVGCKARVRYQPEQPGDVRRTWADLTRSRLELGYTPSTSLKDGLQRQWEWLQASQQRPLATQVPE